jgi:hypothetical protein
MARLQILELPEGAGDERPPFVLVVDQVATERVAPDLVGSASDRSGWERMAAQIGARGVLVFPGTVEIPANEIPLDADGHPVRLRIEADTSRFEQALIDVQAAASRFGPEAQGGHRFHDAGFQDPPRCSVCGMDPSAYRFGGDGRTCERVRRERELGHDFQRMSPRMGELTCSRCGVDWLHWTQSAKWTRCAEARQPKEGD